MGRMRRRRSLPATVRLALRPYRARSITSNVFCDFIAVGLRKAVRVEPAVHLGMQRSAPRSHLAGDSQHGVIQHVCCIATFSGCLH